MAGTFQMEVEFSGLCLFVPHTDGSKVAVLLPDAREHARRNNLETRNHLDGTGAEPHVGYLHIGDRNRHHHHSSAGAWRPQIERIIRLPRCVIEFGESEQLLRVGRGPNLEGVHTVSTEHIAPGLRVKPAMFGDEPGTELLARTVLVAGTIHNGHVHYGPCVFSRQLSAPYPQRDRVTGSLIWKVEVQGDAITVKLSPFKSEPGESFEISLEPENGVLRLTVGNLRNNALEWPELGSPDLLAPNGSDEDFKFFYTLLEFDGGTPVNDRLDGYFLPTPILKLSRSRSASTRDTNPTEPRGGSPHCTDLRTGPQDFPVASGSEPKAVPGQSTE